MATSATGSGGRCLDASLVVQFGCVQGTVANWRHPLYDLYVSQHQIIKWKYCTIKLNTSTMYPKLRMPTCLTTPSKQLAPAQCDRKEWRFMEMFAGEANVSRACIGHSLSGVSCDYVYGGRAMDMLTPAGMGCFSWIGCCDSLGVDPVFQVIRSVRYPSYQQKESHAHVCILNLIPIKVWRGSIRSIYQQLYHDIIYIKLVQI